MFQEISAKKESRIQKGLSPEEEDILIKEECIKIKLYDKQKSLDSISKMLGFDAPQKVDVGLSGGLDLEIGLRNVINWGDKEIFI